MRLSWLLRQRRTLPPGTGLPRRQELPEEAFLPLHVLQAMHEAALGSPADPAPPTLVPVVAVAAPWLTEHHADPEG